MRSAAISQDPERNSAALRSALIVIVAGVLATTLGQTQVLGRIPLQNLLKNRLHVDRTTNAAFFFWISLAWYFKPIAGVVTDAFPLFGTRRKSYMLISTVLAVASWIGLYFVPRRYYTLLWTCILINLFMVIASTVVGAYIVEVAQATSRSGRLTAVRQFVEQACYIFVGPTAGYLGSIAFGVTAASCAGATFLLLPAAIFFLHEQRQRVDSRELLGNARRQLKRVASAKTMWAAAGLMALFYAAPGMATALFYRQQNRLHMNTEMQGFLQFLGGIGGVLAATVYGYACRRLNLRKLLVACLLIATGANLFYLFYTSVTRAKLIDGFNGWGYSLAELALMDLAIRATPPGSEGLGYSLMLSVRNLALSGTDWFGSRLLDHYHFTFASLVLANSLTTFAAVPLVFLLPLAIVGTRDDETRPASGVTEQPPPASAASPVPAHSGSSPPPARIPSAPPAGVPASPANRRGRWGADGSPEASAPKPAGPPPPDPPAVRTPSPRPRRD